MPDVYLVVWQDPEQPDLYRIFAGQLLDFQKFVWQDPEQPDLYRGPAVVRGRPPAGECAAEVQRSLAAWQQLAGPGGQVIALACQNSQRTCTIAPSLENAPEAI